jgi:ElaB/YqjD/DUF883 family membrane-anchored ribosome-binding protein
MAEDHKMRSECAVEFATIKGKVERVANGRKEAMDQISRLAETVSEYHTESLKMSGEIKECLTDHLVANENRVTSLEASSRSAHHRLDFLQNKFWWAIGVIATGGISLGIAILTGAFK